MSTPKQLTRKQKIDFLEWYMASELKDGIYHDEYICCKLEEFLMDLGKCTIMGGDCDTLPFLFFEELQMFNPHKQMHMGCLMDYTEYHIAKHNDLRYTIISFLHAMLTSK